MVVTCSDVSPALPTLYTPKRVKGLAMPDCVLTCIFMFKPMATSIVHLAVFYLAMVTQRVVFKHNNFENENFYSFACNII